MQKRRPVRGGAVHCGEQSCPTKFPLPRQPLDELARLRALHMMHQFSMRPEMASLLASLAFGGGK